jgi:hypothetical protein
MSQLIAPAKDLLQDQSILNQNNILSSLKICKITTKLGCISRPKCQIASLVMILEIH